jgi:transposase
MSKKQEHSKAVPNRQKKQASKRKAVQQVLHPNAAGIDIGAEQSYVAVPADRDETPVRSFGCFTEDLHALAQWLGDCGIDTVAMEATGVYWVPLYQVLESYGFEVYLVNARHYKNVPGRKTDVLDCQWLQQLHSFGLLAASFRPSDEIVVLRSYWRHRGNLVRDASRQVQHMQKALEQMNVQLHKVISDVSGATGMRIINAILAGERDRQKLATLKDPRIRSSRDRIAKALEGDYRPEHLFALRQAVETYRFYQQQIAACDREVEAYMGSMEDRVDVAKNPLPPTKSRRSTKYSNEPDFDLRTHLYRITGVDFTQVEGFNSLTVQTILSEVGLDPSKFKREKNFTSWLAFSPDNRITGGKVKSRKTRKVKNRAADAFRMAAQGVIRSSGPIGAFYRRMRAKLGPPAAITATAHKLARIFYRLWTTREAYDPSLFERYEQQHRERTVSYLRKKAQEFGFELSPRLAAPQVVS